MLTKLFVRDETSASLGKTEHTLIVHDSGGDMNLRDWIWSRVSQEAKPHHTHTLIHRDFSTLLLFTPRMRG